MITWSEDDMPAGYTGSLRMADGRWYAKCRECDEYVYMDKAWPRYMNIGKHEYTVHGLDVVGINVGMMS